eukprot:c20551_g2_i2.p1 GENE.c20551_g2_i2~~c20551_g2_i2.p1  ORF type:complete len:120 (+),score=42.18 c20551_g2_i2:52-411(+)
MSLFRSRLYSNLTQGFRQSVATPSFQYVFTRSMSEAFLSKDNVTERVLSVIKGFDRVEPAKVTAAAHFTNDLGLDSLDAVELLMAVEEEFCIEIPDNDAEKILSTADAIKYICSHPHAK